MSSPDKPAGAGAPATPADDLEHWVKDIRSELGNDPPGWLTSDSAAGDAPEFISPPPTLDGDDVESPPPGPAPRRPGRHRSPD